jgi:cysteinyl-tRNA synthetase
VTIRLKNTATKTVEEYRDNPGHPGVVHMYHCGPTVYQRAHVGNHRAFIFADLIRRTFELAGYDVRQVINITDVGHLTDDGDAGDDKLEREAGKIGKRATDIAREITEFFLHDLAQLHIKTDGTQFPRATDHIAEQIELITSLEQKGFAYATSDGVYFDTSKFEAYGLLGGVAEAITQQREGARVAVNDEKRNPADFALWKLSPQQLDERAPARQQEWESPWGVGFPGWHIECSAMSMKYLGETLDIHTGGIDHIAVHHNDEIAQSEAHTGKEFSRYWMHVNFITIDGQKVSKSLGNTLTLDELSTRFGVSPIAYRYWVLTGHYASQMNLTEDALRGAATALKRLKAAIANLPPHEESAQDRSDARTAVLEIVSNDLDTPGLIAHVWKNVTEGTGWARTYVAAADEILGLNLLVADEILPTPENVLELVRQRDEARAAKDWAASDRLRTEIEGFGFTVKDGPNGTSVERSS